MLRRFVVAMTTLCSSAPRNLFLLTKHPNTVARRQTSDILDRNAATRKDLDCDPSLVICD